MFAKTGDIISKSSYMNICNMETKGYINYADHLDVVYYILKLGFVF